ncbi:DUF1127 domain-containing protein [Profundibacterium mesophilum]|uniref:Conserved small protein n=1 Tax=Profundibacterium mesophilum KAUST100406-0324 TaxID=1037889 RepID=A0A921TCZ5_9RHOB|nr:DUF1127 domain-containing protein [Profundibacterium mesophilum]KAF0675736.1 putative conserved small protein [Profundibacterium mesophilum KAUST100406-0324]
MSMIHTVRPAIAGEAASTRAILNVLRMWDAIVEWNDLRVTRKCLGQLSDSELDDIGLSRSDIVRLGRAR